MADRKVVLDTETTGLETSQGHRILEIGCVEIVNRRLTNRHYHQYIQPERESDEGAVEVHGITSEFLADKPLFADIVDDFLDFVDGAELVIHNAPFDVGFINYEFSLLNKAVEGIEKSCSIVDTLVLARTKHPGQRNSLDALCKRYGVDNSKRELHGALLDAEILADVYLMMTGGQTSLHWGGQSGPDNKILSSSEAKRHYSAANVNVVLASEDELLAHKEFLKLLDKKSDGKCVWQEK